MSELNYINSKKNIILYLVLILTFGLGLRFYYFPYDVPIVTDGFFSFVYAMQTVFDSSLPIGIQLLILDGQISYRCFLFFQIHLILYI